MTEEMPKLKRFERRETDVVLAYVGGDEFTITYDDLRHACPCAKCSPLRNADETSKSLRRQVEALPKEKPQVRIVGNYALGFEWNTGCSSGIYRFERIWDLANRRDPDNGRPYVHGAW
ncbi:MAG: gamma-butyrobetaine hydroxylase-like domain-containing protein [Euryarchaeota archaeon]